MTASLATLRRNCGGRAVDDLVPTMTAGAEHHALVEYKLSPEHEEGALRVAAFLISYCGTENTSAADAPAPTVTTKDRLGLVTVFVKGTPYVIEDICLRSSSHTSYTAPKASQPATSSTRAPTASRSPKLSRCTCAGTA